MYIKAPREEEISNVLKAGRVATGAEIMGTCTILYIRDALPEVLRSM